ncbi:MAG: ATP-binding protein [Cyanobacteriota bacterium]
MPNAKLLIVEDEEIVAFDIESTLKDLGYQVLGIVASGEDAIATAARTQPDLVLMDIMLKGSIDGIEAAREIRSLMNLPVLYLTAYADTTTFERAKETEPFGYLIKPFEEKELQTSIEIALARHQSEERMRQKLKQEQANNEQKSHFISIASHEFRTPLATIYSSSALLQRYCQDAMNEKKSKHFQQIQTSIEQMTQLLDDVLVIGQADAGKLEFKVASLNLVEFCRNLVEELQLNAGNHHKIVFTSQGNCTNACMDDTLLRRILTNLLSNAIKYSPEGGDVFFELSCQEEIATFGIQDRGIGIPPEEQKELFTPFHRAANAQKIKGTGLGLSIVKRCVDVHSGQIFVDSKLGIGTKFTVTLPLENRKGERLRGKG